MDRREFCRTLAWAGPVFAGGAALKGAVQPDPRAGARPPFLYVLRLTMPPNFHEAERLESLLSFCREAQIDDVAFILWAEELNTGFPTPEEVEPWLETVERVKPKLAAAGVTTSLNPWVVLLHADRGRTLKPGQNFKLMVDPDGRQATACSCPLDPALHDYLRLHYQRLARVQPRIIWVDDDFRLHNHSPLRWGGCFCDLHMMEYSRRAGRTLSREEFVKGVLQPGEPHPYRRIWLDTGRDAMVRLAKLLGDTVRSVSPETQVGLMSSSPAVHCIEGRDWEAVLRALSAGKPPVNRPHLPSYTEASGADYLWNFSRVSRLSAASVPADTLLYPELENWPHSRFAKSRAFTRYQIESAAALSPAGITMDIFDLFGNGAMAGEGYAKELRQAKGLAGRLRELNLAPAKETGVQVLFNPKASYAIRTENGESFGELAPDENFWAGFLAVMGIAHTYRQWSDQKLAVLAISGQYFRGLEDKQIRPLMADNVVLLNGDAMWTIYQMGMGNLIGISRAEWMASDSGAPSYEQVIDGRVYAGLRDGRLTAQAMTGDYLKVEYSAEARVHTEVRNPSGARTGPGMAVVSNRHIMLPYGRGTDYRGLRHPVRQSLLQTMLSELAGDRCPVYLRETANVAVYSYDLGTRRALLLTNASYDDYAAIDLGGMGSSMRRVDEISSLGVRTVKRAAARGNLISTGLGPLEVKALVFGD